MGTSDPKAVPQSCPCPEKAVLARDPDAADPGVTAEALDRALRALYDHGERLTAIEERVGLPSPEMIRRGVIGFSVLGVCEPPPTVVSVDYSSQLIRLKFGRRP